MAQPLYQQIADDLRAKIEAGNVERGSQLPTEQELRDQYRASRNTIRDAIRLLVNVGLVETRPGQGTFVTPKLNPIISNLTDIGARGQLGGTSVYQPSDEDESQVEHREPEFDEVRVEVLVAPPEIAANLGLQTGSQVVSRHRGARIEGIPWILETTFYPMEMVTLGASRLLLADDIPNGAVPYLEGVLGLHQGAYRDLITARSPNPAEQAFFRIAHDTTVFVIYRTGFDQNGKPMRVTVDVCPADRNQFIVTVGDVPTPATTGAPLIW